MNRGRPRARPPAPPAPLSLVPARCPRRISDHQGTAGVARETLAPAEIALLCAPHLRWLAERAGVDLGWLCGGAALLALVHRLLFQRLHPLRQRLDLGLMDRTSNR